MTASPQLQQQHEYGGCQAVSQTLETSKQMLSGDQQHPTLTSMPTVNRF